MAVDGVAYRLVVILGYICAATKVLVIAYLAICVDCYSANKIATHFQILFHAITLLLWATDEAPLAKPLIVANISIKTNANPELLIRAAEVCYGTCAPDSFAAM